MLLLGGLSAGAASGAHHLTAYGSRDEGLFRAAAAESVSSRTMLTTNKSFYRYKSLAIRLGAPWRGHSRLHSLQVCKGDSESQQRQPLSQKSGSTPLQMVTGDGRRLHPRRHLHSSSRASSSKAQPSQATLQTAALASRRQTRRLSRRATISQSTVPVLRAGPIKQDQRPLA